MPEPNGINGWGLVLGIGVPAAALLSSLIAGTTWLNSVDGKATQASSDIVTMKERLAKDEERYDQTRAEMVALKPTLTEIETQFCAESDIINLHHAADMRLMGMLWQKTFGQIYPTDNAFYPNVGKCK
jgi:hypothetical protein